MNKNLQPAIDAMCRVYLAATGEPGKGFEDLPYSTKMVAIQMGRSLIGTLRDLDPDVVDEICIDHGITSEEVTVAWQGIIDKLLIQA